MNKHLFASHLNISKKRGGLFFAPQDEMQWHSLNQNSRLKRLHTLQPTLSIEGHRLHLDQNSLIYNPPPFNCNRESIKLPVGRWHLSVRPARIDVPESGSCPPPATQPNHFYEILRNFLFNTAHYCWHTNLPQHGPHPIYGLINFYTAEPSPFPSFCHHKIHII